MCSAWTTPPRSPFGPDQTGGDPALGVRQRLDVEHPGDALPPLDLAQQDVACRSRPAPRASAAATVDFPVPPLPVTMCRRTCGEVMARHRASLGEAWARRCGPCGVRASALNRPRSSEGFTRGIARCRRPYRLPRGEARWTGAGSRSRAGHGPALADYLRGVGADGARSSYACACRIRPSARTTGSCSTPSACSVLAQGEQTWLTGRGADGRLHLSVGVRRRHADVRRRTRWTRSTRCGPRRCSTPTRQHVLAADLAGRVPGGCARTRGRGDRSAGRPGPPASRSGPSPDTASRSRSTSRARSSSPAGSATADRRLPRGHSPT